MTKVKYLLLFVIVAMLILVFPNIAHAADYATEPVVEYTRIIPSNDGTIKINFTGLELDVMQAYEFALVRQGGTPEKWFSIDDGYTAATASITLSCGTTAIVDVLKATDTGFVYMRKQNDTESDYILEAYQVDLKLPYLQSLAYTKDEENKRYDVAKLLYGSIGNQYAYLGSNDDTYIKWQKITDRKLIEDYLDIKNNSGDISDLESSLPVPPITGYEANRLPSYSNKDDGLYLLWVKRMGQNCKEVYSCIVHDGLEEATSVEQYIAGLDVEKPTVQSIAVTSPQSGTYKTGQTVKITVTFSEEITGETVPTLKIKFGTSEERTVTNGTISGKTIVYSYNIVDGDKGQLAITGYTGGTIKDAAGNDATIETKVVSGNTIKANVEGTTTNNTENQDKTNTENNDDNTSNNTDNSTNNNSSTNNSSNNSSTTTQDDTTTASGKLPQTGLSICLSFAIAVLIAGCVFAYLKYSKLRGI